MILPPSIAAFLGKWGLALAGLAVALLATFYAGKLHERSGWESRRVEQVQAARETERAGGEIANTAETQYQAHAAQQLEKAHAELETLRAQLKRVPRCPVPRDVVRLLDGERMPATAAAPAVTRGPAESVAAAAAEPAVECTAVIEHCAVNRATVCEPNALQVRALQQFYDDVRRRYNTQP